MYLTALNQTQTQIENWFELLFLFKPRIEPTLLLWRLCETQKNRNQQSETSFVAGPELNWKNDWFESITDLLPWRFQFPVIHHVMLAEFTKKSTTICVKINNSWKL